MADYDEALKDFTEELIMRIRELNSEIEILHNHLNEAYRQIALLQDQVRHYYL